MIVTAELLAFARGYSEGVAGTDTLPYHQIDEPDLVKIYYVGRAHGVCDGSPSIEEPPEPETSKHEPAIPITAKTKG
jgi:hypothetical protein